MNVSDSQVSDGTVSRVTCYRRLRGFLSLVPRVDWFVQVDVAIADFNVEAAARVNTDPGLVVDGCSVETIVR